MNKSPRDNALTYLRSHTVMTLATTGPEGLWAAAVFYATDSLALYFLSAPTSRHSQNIASHPGVAFTIQEDYKDWQEIKGIQGEGIATRLAEPDRRQAIDLYGQKFPIVGQLNQAPAKIVAAFNNVAWYRLTPTRLYFIDNSRGFGHRDEIPL